MSGISKIASERIQRNLLELAAQPGNDICADCKSRNPRWASHNLGIFICVNCASIHRKLGTHITKVKSMTLDSWTKEQVEVMKQNGNIKSNNLYNPDEARNPPPTNMMEIERDSEIEKFIRAKYEFKWFMNYKPSHFVPPARSSSNTLAERPMSTSATGQRRPSPAPPPVPAKNFPSGRGIEASNVVTSALHSGPTPAKTTRSISQPVSTPGSSAPIHKLPGNQVWDDLISLQVPSQSSSLPLQYQPQDFSSPPSSLPSQLHAVPLAHPIFHVSPNPFSTLQGSHMMPSSMPSMSSPTSVTPMPMVAGGPSPNGSPQTPFQQPFSGYPSPNMSNSIPLQMQMGASGMSGTPTMTPLPQQQSYFASSFGQTPQPMLGHMQDPNLMYAQQQSQVVQQRYSPQLQFGATPGFVAQQQQQQQQQVFPTNAAYGGWQNMNMHGNFQ